MQVSDQCVNLVKAGWLDQQQEPSGVSTLTDPKVSKHTACTAGPPFHFLRTGQASSLREAYRHCHCCNVQALLTLLVHS